MFKKTLNIYLIFLSIKYVRSQFGSLAQVMDKLRPKKPNTMNL